MNGALYRGLRPVMWSPVEKTALAEAEIEYHDHVSPTLWARFPVLRAPAGAPDLAGASVVIWTTTPWTIPGNRAVAYGEEIDYALVHVEGVAEGSLPQARRDACWSRCRCCRSSRKDTGLGAHTVKRVLKGAELAGAILAHPLRGWDAAKGGYDFDVPLLPGDFVTTEAGTGFVHIAPGHGEDDFALGRAHGLPVPETVNDDGTFTAQAPGFTGLHVFKAHEADLRRLRGGGHARRQGEADAQLPAFLALQEAGDLPRHAAVVHRPRRRAPHPRAGARGDRRDALRARRRPQPHRQHGRRRGPTGASAASAPGACRSPSSSRSRRGEPLRDPAVMERIVDGLRRRRAPTPGTSRAPPSASSAPTATPAVYEQVTDIVDVWFESGCTHAFILTPERGLPFPADLYLEGSDQHRGWFQSSLLGVDRHPRRRALPGGADARLHARRAGPEDVEVARQRHRARRR